MRTIAPPKKSGHRPRTGRWVVAPPTQEAMERRRRARAVQVRRRVLVGLLLCAFGSGAAAIARGGAWAEVHLMADGVVLAYVALLLELRRRSAERVSKVRHLPAMREMGSAPLQAVGERSS